MMRAIRISKLFIKHIDAVDADTIYFISEKSIQITLLSSQCV